MLCIDPQGRFPLGDADQPGIQADIVTDLGNTSEDDVIGSHFLPDLCCHGFIDTHWPLFVEGSLNSGSFDDLDPAFHSDTGRKDVIDTLSQIIEILLTVNHKRKDGHFINLAGVSGLGDRRRWNAEHKTDK